MPLYADYENAEFPDGPVRSRDSRDAIRHQGDPEWRPELEDADPKCEECGDRWPVERGPYPELCDQCGLVAHREDQADRKGN